MEIASQREGPGGLIQIPDDQIEVQPVLADLPFTDALEPDGEPVRGCRQHHELAVCDRDLHGRSVLHAAYTHPIRRLLTRWLK